MMVFIDSRIAIESEKEKDQCQGDKNRIFVSIHKF